MIRTLLLAFALALLAPAPAQAQVVTSKTYLLYDQTAGAAGAAINTASFDASTFSTFTVLVNNASGDASRVPSIQAYDAAGVWISNFGNTTVTAGSAGAFTVTAAAVAYIRITVPAAGTGSCRLVVYAR